MKSLKSLNIIIVLLFIFSVSISAQVNKKAAIKQIEAYSQTLDAFVKSHKTPNLITADVSDYTKNTPAVWKKFKSAKALDRAGYYESADVWQKDNKVVVANFSFYSPSGDWASFTNHYYRADGSLAKVEYQLNTFALEGHPISLIQNNYYDQNGKLLRKTTKYYNPETKKQKKAGEVNFMNRDAEIFKKTSQLPFASLVGKI